MTEEAEPEGKQGGKPAKPAKRTRRPRPFPNISFNEALVLANAIQEHGSGQKIRRLTLFDALERSPDSGPTRKLIIGSNQYGLTTGSYSAEFLDLTDEGRAASDPSASARAKRRAQINLAITNIDSFKTVYEKYKGGRLPASDVLRDSFIEAGIDADMANQAVEVFLANARELGLVKTISGSEHLVSVDAVIDEINADPAPAPTSTGNVATGAVATGTTNVIQFGSLGANKTAASTAAATAARTDLSTTCFIVSPIGSNDSEQRKHADLVLTALIEPALADLGLTAVRADQIGSPGLITAQVIDHVARAALVIADLSFANPNVYYEVALRQAVRKPMVQITRSSDPLPFDVGQFRTYVIDMSDIYTLVPQIDLHRKEITRQCRSALEDGAPAESQLSQFCPHFWDQIAEGTA
ncbi:hypothetical protein [Mycolicibacterium palauense]|uniref:hypothetical protein n=1 Tax=Mycolicibacterium palauense TaxID=2034511 RepID=UPI000BFEF191|nr:hypothetical protein [Mycolicibacterium palauense]